MRKGGLEPPRVLPHRILKCVRTCAPRRLTLATRVNPALPPVGLVSGGRIRADVGHFLDTELSGLTR